MIKIILLLVVVYFIYSYFKTKKKIEKDLKFCRIIAKKTLTPVIEENNNVESLLGTLSELQEVFDKESIFYKSLELVDLLDKKQKENTHYKFLASCYLSCAIGETRVYLFQNVNKEIDKEQLFKIIDSINSIQMQQAILEDFILKANHIKSIYKKHKENKSINEDEQIIIEELLDSAQRF